MARGYTDIHLKGGSKDSEVIMGESSYQHAH